MNRVTTNKERMLINLSDLEPFHYHSEMVAPQHQQAGTLPLTMRPERTQLIVAFLSFLQDARARLSKQLVSQANAEVRMIRGAIESHYVDDQGKPAMYLQFESALYDDAQSMVTLWSCFDDYGRTN